jgi:hypothetical protein
MEISLIFGSTLTDKMSRLPSYIPFHVLGHREVGNYPPEKRAPAMVLRSPDGGLPERPILGAVLPGWTII